MITSTTDTVAKKTQKNSLTPNTPPQPPRNLKHQYAKNKYPHTSSADLAALQQKSAR